MPKNRPQPLFRFRSGDSIGAIDAEHDPFLDKCFVDTGVIERLVDPKDPKFILIGRTGSGKTAIIRQLTERQKDISINLDPQSLALDHILTSEVLVDAIEAGVDFSLFFKTLWQHVILCEMILREAKHAKVEKTSIGWKTWLSQRFGQSDNLHQDAHKFFEEYGKDFWATPGFRVQEIATELAKDIEGTVSSSLGIDGTLTGSLSGSSSTRDARKIVLADKKDQIRRLVTFKKIEQLRRAESFLSQILRNDQRRYIVTVDGLDESWCETPINYRLTRALLDYARSLGGNTHVKIVIALRVDLYVETLRQTYSSFQQEEKYLDHGIDLTWTKKEILEVLESRVQYLGAKHNSPNLTYRHLLPSHFRSTQIDDVVFGLCQRPRDVIDFFNHCIRAAGDSASLSETQLSTAISAYSNARYNALVDEWQVVFPALRKVAAGLLQGMPLVFKVSELPEAVLDRVAAEHVYEKNSPRCPFEQESSNYYTGRISASELRRRFTLHLYECGLLGLKIDPKSAFFFRDSAHKDLQLEQIAEDTQVQVRRQYARVFGINDKIVPL